MFGMTSYVITGRSYELLKWSAFDPSCRHSFHLYDTLCSMLTVATMSALTKINNML